MLFLSGVLPTLQPESASFGRVYATYGGVFIVLSLLWGWCNDGARPDRFDLTGGAIIMYTPRTWLRIREGNEEEQHTTGRDVLVG